MIRSRCSGTSGLRSLSGSGVSLNIEEIAQPKCRPGTDEDAGDHFIKNDSEEKFGSVIQSLSLYLFG